MKKQLSAFKESRLDDAEKEQMLSALRREMGRQPLSASPSTGKAVFVALKEQLRTVSLKPVGLMLLLFGIISVPGVATVSAARASLPGDVLYPVKRNIEDIRLRLSFSDTARVQTQISHVSSRLDELQRIAREYAPSAARQQKMRMALEALRQETNEAKLSLKQVEEEQGGQSDDVIALARQVDQQAADYTENIQKSVRSLEESNPDNSDEAQDLETAISSVQDVALGALDILAEKHEQGDKTVEGADLKKRVESQLTGLKDKVNALRVRLARLKSLRAKDSVPTTEQAETGEENAEPETAEVSEGDQSAAEPEQQAPEPNGEENTEESDQTPEERREENTSSEGGAELATVAEIETTLDEETAKEIAHVEELLGLEQFRSALDRLSATKETVDALTADVRQRIQQQIDERARAVQQQATDAPRNVKEGESEGAEEATGQEEEEASEEDETQATEETSEPGSENEEEATEGETGSESSEDEATSEETDENTKDDSDEKDSESEEDSSTIDRENEGSVQ